MYPKFNNIYQNNCIYYGTILQAKFTATVTSSDAKTWNLTTIKNLSFPSHRQREYDWDTHLQLMQKCEKCIYSSSTTTLCGVMFMGRHFIESQNCSDFFFCHLFYDTASIWAIQCWMSTLLQIWTGFGTKWSWHNSCTINAFAWKNWEEPQRPQPG
jgi:hypothetical protein